MTGRGEINIVLMTWDRVSGTMTLTREDGMEATFPMEEVPAHSPQIARIQWSPFALTGMLVKTTAGDEFVIELPTTPEGAGDRAGRPVVYLDQLHWSTFHKLEAGARVHPDDAAAAEQISDWATRGHILLPASSGHYRETTQWSNGTERYKLGVRVLTLSRGWHMRDPLAVRRDELRRVFLDLAGETPEPVPPVFTRDTEAMLSARPLKEVEAPTGFPPEIARAHALLTRAIAMVAVMLDDEAIPSARPTGWSNVQQKYSDWLRTEERDTSRKRESIDAMLVGDLRTDIAEEAMRAGLTPAEMSEWIVDGAWKQQMAGMPSLGLYREVYHQRHLAGVRWTENDLTDMVYLACAAGYADFVVTERHMAAFLNQSSHHLERATTVYRRLRDLLDPLRHHIHEQSDRGLCADRAHPDSV